MDIHYRIPSYGEEETTCMRLDGDWDVHLPGTQRYLLEECAEDHFHNHDGWESSWPLVFALHDGENGPEICRYEVEMEAVPQFVATKI